MNRRDLLLLFLLSLLVLLAIAQFQSLPGYMDADYYFGGGLQLVRGNGFNEPYLWNYLAEPPSVPTPSHAYWLPLASILAALSMWLTGQSTFAAARLGFILLAALVPPLTSLLAFRVTANRASSLLSGLLACFPIFYSPFLPVTDNYAIYMLLGISFFLLLSSLADSKKHFIVFFGFGLVSALASLARSDGLLWLGLSFLVAIWFAFKKIDTYTGTQVNTEYEVRNSHSASSNPSLLSRIPQHLLSAFCILIGFLLLASPWYARNLHVFGSLMAPGGSRALWLTSYNDTFAFPASQLTMQSWLASGWDAILQARLDALRINLLNAFGAQGGVFLFPFILVGLWAFRRDVRVRFAALAWILLLVAMTIVFPFAGPRGAFFHSGAALQPMWWVLAPIGLELSVASIRRRGWLDDRAFVIFRGALVGISILMTLVVLAMRVLPGWEREDGIYLGVNELLLQSNPSGEAVVIVRNPPGFYLISGHPSVAIPSGGLEAVLDVSRKFNARYFIVEPTRVTGVIYDTRLNQYPFNYIGGSDGIRLYEILR